MAEQRNPLPAEPCSCEAPRPYVDPEDGQYRCNGCGRVAPVPARRRKEKEELVQLIRLATRHASRETAKEIAERIVELQNQAPPSTRLLSAAEVALQTGRSRDWVYRNRLALGGRPIGDGPRPRWWFPPDAGTRPLENQTPTPQPSANKSTTRQPRQRRRTGDLLPIKGERRAA